MKRALGCLAALAVVCALGCGAGAKPRPAHAGVLIPTGPSAPPPAFVMRAFQRDWQHRDCGGMRRDERVYERLPGVARTALARHAMQAAAEGAYRQCMSLSRGGSPRP